MTVLIMNGTLQRQKMKKSSSTKKGSCLSFATANLKDDATLELMRISLKKEGDRKDRLQKLLARYESIRAEERTHVKAIKSSIIELKDRQAVAKIHFLVDPNIYVDNNLSVETREFLCMLLNTFYKRYEQNKDQEGRAVRTVQSIRSLIKSISYNEELLFKVQKLNINHQVQLEGELLSQKNTLKEQTHKMKELQNEKNRIAVIWNDNKRKFEEERNKTVELQKVVADLEAKIVGLTEKITQGEEIRQGNQQKLSGQMAYQLKFEEEVNLLRQAVTLQCNRQKQLKKKITEKKLRIDKLKGPLNFDNTKHEVSLRILNLSSPRPSSSRHGVAAILQLENTFSKTLSGTWATTKPIH